MLSKEAQEILDGVGRRTVRSDVVSKNALTPLNKIKVIKYNDDWAGANRNAHPGQVERHAAEQEVILSRVVRPMPAHVSAPNRNIRKAYGSAPCTEGHQSRHPSGRVLHAAGPQRLRQDHAAASHRRFPPAGRRRHPGGWEQSIGQSGRQSTPCRHGVPGLRGVPAPERVRQRGLRVGAAQGGGREIRQRVQAILQDGATRSAWRSGCRTSSAADSSSAWAWRARW
jgi:hypothetical protein